MLPIDDTGLDLQVRIHFDEGRNELRFSVTSSRQLYGFPLSVVHKNIFSRCYSVFGGRKLNLMKMPVPALIPPKARFQMNKTMYHKFHKPRRKHTYNAWYMCDGLVPLSAPDPRLLLDSLVQTFSVEATATQCAVTLRDLIALDRKPRSEKSERKNGVRYLFASGQDLLRTYRITLQRNPCFAMEPKVAEARLMVDSLKHDQQLLKEHFALGMVPNQASLTIFEQTKQLMQYRFPRVSTESACPDLQRQYDRYNALLDSLDAFTVVIDPRVEEARPLVRGIEPEYLLSNARQVDYLVASYFQSKTFNDGNDLLMRCQQLIKAVNDAIVENGIYTPEQRQALEVFRRAERYYQSILKQQREQ